MKEKEAITPEHWARAMDWCRESRLPPGEAHIWERAVEATREEGAFESATEDSLSDKYADYIISDLERRGNSKHFFFEWSVAFAGETSFIAYYASPRKISDLPDFISTDIAERMPNFHPGGDSLLVFVRPQMTPTFVMSPILLLRQNLTGRPFYTTISFPRFYIEHPSSRLVSDWAVGIAPAKESSGRHFRCVYFEQPVGIPSYEYAFTHPCFWADSLATTLAVDPVTLAKHAWDSLPDE